MLNPVEEDPSDHLEIDETGVLIPKTGRGEACIDIFGLNAREALLNARRECVEQTNNALRLASMAAAARDEAQLGLFIERASLIKSGAAVYAAAARMALRRAKPNLERLISVL